MCTSTARTAIHYTIPSMCRTTLSQRATTGIPVEAEVAGVQRVPALRVRVWGVVREVAGRLGAKRAAEGMVMQVVVAEIVVVMEGVAVDAVVGSTSYCGTSEDIHCGRLAGLNRRYAICSCVGQAFPRAPCLHVQRGCVGPTWGSLQES